MDVYLTCLVAIDKSGDETLDEAHDDIATATAKSISNTDWDKRVDKEVKLPVLLNLSACTLKLGMFKKTCAFCDMALEMESGKCPKVYFRRGRAHIAMGMYEKARHDLNVSQTYLLAEERSEEVNKMVQSVKKEIAKLEAMVETAEKNRARQEKAMKRMLGGMPRTKDDGLEQIQTLEYSSNEVLSDPSGEERLYNDVGKREYSTLRARSNDKIPREEEQRGALVWYIKMVERSLRKILYWLGDEDAMIKSFDGEVRNDKKDL